MKKKLSLLLILALLLGLFGCAAQPAPATQPQTEPPITQATLPPETEAPQKEQITVPNLLGQQVHKLAESEEYQVQVSKTIPNASLAEGTIQGQAPVAGSVTDKGSVIYVIVTTGGPEEPVLTEPEETQPAPRPTTPVYTEPQRPEQTDPPVTEPQPQEPQETDPPATEPQGSLDPDGVYDSKEDVALFIYLYHRLPDNYMTKKQAKQQYGWKRGTLSQYGKCIGGDRFYNNEGLLPGNETYYECDIDTLNSSSRGAKRLVFTKSGIVYYTDDHYESFTRLY